jgi:hypothetical protein
VYSDYDNMWSGFKTTVNTLVLLYNIIKIIFAGFSLEVLSDSLELLVLVKLNINK